MAILVILGGIIGITASVLKLLVMPRAFEALPSQMTDAFREMNDRVDVRVGNVIEPFFAIAGLIGGIGMFRLKGWARTLIIIVAALSVLWAGWFSFQIPLLQERILATAQRMLREQLTQERIREIVNARVVRLWIDQFIDIAWNGFIIWFFLRPSVKVQFISKTTNR